MAVPAHHDDFPFNDTYMAELRNATETCGYNEYIAKALTFPPDGHFENPVGINSSTSDPTDSCDVFDSIFSEIFNINPCKSSRSRSSCITICLSNTESIANV
jgi:carboxypeptidase D